MKPDKKTRSANTSPTRSEPEDMSLEDTSVWVDHYGDYLLRFAVFRVRNTETAEDLVQETFLAAHSARDRFEGKSSVKTWLVTILKNKIIDHFRKSAREPEIQPEILGEDVMQANFNRLGIWKTWLSEWEATPEALADQQQFLSQFQRCLNSLPDRLRQVFVLRALDDVETEAVCEQLKVSSGNLWVILHRSRLQLRTCLEKNWFRAIKI